MRERERENGNERVSEVCWRIIIKIENNQLGHNNKVSIGHNPWKNPTKRREIVVRSPATVDIKAKQPKLKWKREILSDLEVADHEVRR